MARSQSRGSDPARKASSTEAGWAKLTWDDLEQWAGARSVSRGRSYQRGGRVKDLMISGDGELLATVMGGDRYVTTVALESGRKRKQPSLSSSCTCPVAIRCKHAVAVVAEYLKAVAEGRQIPVTSDEDPRWADLEQGSPEIDDDWDEQEDGRPWWDDEEEGAPLSSRPGGRKQTARAQTSRTNWDDKIEQHLRAKSQSELADVVWSLARRFPEIYQEFRERIALQEGDVGRLVKEARREIRQVTSEQAWRNNWTGEGHTPDYRKIRHRFERLLALGHADEVVALGREFIEQGMQQVGESDDEGDTAMAFGECLPVVFQAVARSSLSGSERLLFAIDAELADGYDVIGDASEAVFDMGSQPENWSAVADILAQRLKAIPASGQPRETDFYRNYQRDQLTDWIARALQEAGRDEELRALYESEARTTGSYKRLVEFLLKTRHFDDAERWAREGIAATAANLSGIAARLAESLCELAQKRKQWDVVAAHAAYKFFADHPSRSSFDELMKSAKKAGVEAPVRAAALHFLETGARPYQVTAPRPRPATDTATRRGSSVKNKKKSITSARSAAAPQEAASVPARVKVDPAWPLPVPDYLVLLDRPGRYDSAPRPHLEVLLDMAIAAKRPDEVLHWFDKMGSSSKSKEMGYRNNPVAHADRVAAAVSASHPERALEIYLAALNAQLPHAQQSAYENAVAYLRKLSPVYEALDRASEWTALLGSIRDRYRNRPRFMELLDGIEGRTIVQSARLRGK